MSYNRQQERVRELHFTIPSSALPPNKDPQQPEPISSLSKEEIKQRAEELRDTARDARARAHQAAERTRKSVQKTEELVQHSRAWQEREAAQRSLRVARDSPVPTESPPPGL